MLRSAPVPLIVAACSILAACGAGGSEATLGAAVFRSQCSSCHTLTGRDSPRKQGGDLLGYTLSRVQVLQFTREMPTGRSLSPRETQAVSDYLLAAERRRAATR